MQLLIKKLDEWPDVARAKVWRELIGCSPITMRRAERAGALIPSGTQGHKLYTKTAILRWIGVQE
jgi:hypothetical protein